jgi:hypothetical protein
MTIKEDAGKFLIFIYKEYIKGNEWLVSKDFIETTKWDAGRINRAIDYLKDLRFIKIMQSLGNTNGVYNFGIRGLEPIGINLIETPDEFKKNFGLEIKNPETYEIVW